MLKIYIASKYQEKARVIRELITNLGHVSTGGWIDVPDFAKPGRPDALLCQRAEEDLEDVRKAEALILIAEDDQEYSSGGRHTELGYMLALGCPVIVYGRRENVFHYLPEIEFVRNDQELVDALCRLRGTPSTTYLS